MKKKQLMSFVFLFGLGCRQGAWNHHEYLASNEDESLTLRTVQQVDKR
jgi:hypothetical protein